MPPGLLKPDWTHLRSIFAKLNVGSQVQRGERTPPSEPSRIGDFVVLQETPMSSRAIDTTKGPGILWLLVRADVEDLLGAVGREVRGVGHLEPPVRPSSVYGSISSVPDHGRSRNVHRP
jgi:hypothetical protein